MENRLSFESFVELSSLLIYLEQFGFCNISTQLIELRQHSAFLRVEEPYVCSGEETGRAKECKYEIGLWTTYLGKEKVHVRFLRRG